MEKRINLSLACSILLLVNSTMAQSSEQLSASSATQCDHVIPTTQYLIDGEQLNILAGDTVCLAAGNRGPLRVKNVVGTTSSPITIRNQNGIVTFKPYEYSISIQSSKWVRLTSIEVEGAAKYGIRLGGTLGVGGLSEYIEIDHIEVYQARFAGMLIKTDPTCEQSTWAENFTMRGVNIHNNYVHDTQTGEGFYIGYTGKYRTLNCDGQEIVAYPHKIEDVNIHNNRLENIAADGIQLNSVKGKAKISNNTIYRTGVSPFDKNWQNTGIQVGGDDVEVTGNLIYRSGGNGMMLDGDGLKIEDNHIIFAGENGIFSRNPAQQNANISDGVAHSYKRNLIIHPASYGIKIYAINTRTAHEIVENTFENDGVVDAAGREMTLSYLNNQVIRSEVNNHHYVTKKPILD
ncbi:right-handed parallel beta-helix repeat-containing protein (plasmid) [Pseudoalteromonas sp. T1lg65]|uniref:right-handed parallel beta-helix repeat-containing protein n=1 Tax=Pseudoalteromonas sp. T1lg65 TaxID=2077101 RepID=UPI003F7A6E8A